MGVLLVCESLSVCEALFGGDQLTNQPTVAVSAEGREMRPCGGQPLRGSSEAVGLHWEQLHKLLIDSSFAVWGRRTCFVSLCGVRVD